MKSLPFINDKPLMAIILMVIMILPSITGNSIADEQTETYDLLIIAPNQFCDELGPLVDHKIQYQVNTLLVSMEDIYSSRYYPLTGRDDAEKMKYFIKYAADTWNIEHVLLVGGRILFSKTEDYWVPVRYSQLIRDYPGYEAFAENDFLCDLYFADINQEDGSFSSWDDDNDGLFGEWLLDESATDKPDLYPDVSVGRLPCSSERDVEIMVEKIISYETGIADDSWFKKLIVIAGDTYPVKTPFIDGEVYTQQVIDILADFQSVKIWSTLGNLNWLTMVKEINKGAGFLFFSGHGGGNSWSTHPPNDINNWTGDFKLRHMNFLVNAEKLPVCLSASGCFNNMFNVSPRNSFLIYGRILGIIPVKYFITKCWGWALASNPRGGSIATIASTAYSYESSDIDGGRGGCEWLDIHFFESYKHSKNRVLGDCWVDTINRFLQNFSIDWSNDSKTGDALVVKNLQQWALIGDPSLKIGGYTS